MIYPDQQLQHLEADGIKKVLLFYIQEKARKLHF